MGKASHLFCSCLEIQSRLYFGEDNQQVVSLTHKEEAMTLSEILPTVRQLPTLDKIRLIRILAEELDLEEDIFPFEPYKIYYLSTPYNAFGAGKALMDAMRMADSHNT